MTQVPNYCIVKRTDDDDCALSEFAFNSNQEQGLAGEGYVYRTPLFLTTGCESHNTNGLLYYIIRPRSENNPVL